MKRSFIVISALFMGLYFLGGCSKEIKGPPRGNIPPLVDFVNIPVEGARFSSDTTIYWYGTDVDGFIRYFRYAVIESTVVGADPEMFIRNTPDSNINWTVLSVNLDNPHTKEKIKMSADVRDPVRKYVASYIFLEAIDNLDAKSDVVYRLFRKNNHFPNTLIATRPSTQPYVNAVSSAGVLSGVSITLDGEDPIDYPRNPPPFEFRWKLLGPYDSTQMVYIDRNFVESVFVDIYGDFYKKGDFYKTVKTIDTTIDTLVAPPDTTIDTTFNYILVDTLRQGNVYGTWGNLLLIDSLPPNLSHIVEQSHDPLSGGEWVTSKTANIYDVFNGYPSDTTRLQYFLLWAQCRDDSKTPDVVPPYSWISVIDPKFERDVMLFDATKYLSTDDNYPITNTTVRSVYGQMINAWKPGSFDTLNILPKDSFLTSLVPKVWEYLNYPGFKCTQDYFAASATKTPLISAFKIRDVLKHKIVIIIKDSPTKQINMSSAEGLAVLDGLSAGMSAWVMVRAPFTRDPNAPYLSMVSTSTEYKVFFGVDRAAYTGWLGLDRYFTCDTCPYSTSGQYRIEDFIGAASLSPEFPDLSLNDSLLEVRYKWKPGTIQFAYPYRCSDGSILVGALPEVGYVEKLSFAEPLYLYNSMFGTNQPAVGARCDGIFSGFQSNMNGTVVAVRSNLGLYRTAHFCFTFLPFDQSTAQVPFNSMMDWLSVQPYISSAGKISSFAPRGDFSRVKQILNQLHELQDKGMLPASMTSD